MTKNDKGTADPTDDVLVYTPAPGFKGPDTFTYTIKDGRGGTDEATVTVVVSDADPVAIDDERTTPHDKTVDIDVLGNDFDPNPGDTVKLVPGSATAPKTADNTVKGTVTEHPDGSISYDPPTGFAGVVTFTYQITDGNQGTAPSTATVTVIVENAPPVAVPTPPPPPGERRWACTVLGNDSDVNNDALTIAGISPTKAGGTVVVQPGQHPHLHPAGRLHRDRHLHVHDLRRPRRHGPGDGDGDRAQRAAGGGRRRHEDGGRHGGGDRRTRQRQRPQRRQAGRDRLHRRANHGTVTIIAEGLVVYTPTVGYTGPDEFTYEISDGRGGTATAKVTIDVLNTAPDAINDNAGTLPDTDVTVKVLKNDFDPDEGHDVEVSEIVEGPKNGTAKLNSDGTITYTPAKGFAGTDTLIYEIVDGHGGSDTATVTIEVSNAAPVAIDDLISGLPDKPVTIPVLENDFDPNPNDKVSVVPDSLTPPVDADGKPHGSVKVGDDGVVTYTPPAGFAGTVTFQYAVTDGDPQTPNDTATVTVTIPNAPPVAGDDAVTLPAPGVAPVPLDVLKNDSDPNQDPMTIVGTSTPAHGRVVIGTDGRPIYTPDPDFSGTDSFEYTISDGHGGTATAKVTITVPAPAPLEPAGPGTPSPPGTPAPPAPATPEVLGVEVAQPGVSAKPPTGVLPVTGRSIFRVAAAAWAAVLAGQALRLAGRRRRRES